MKQKYFLSFGFQPEGKNREICKVECDEHDEFMVILRMLKQMCDEDCLEVALAKVSAGIKDLLRERERRANFQEPCPQI